MFLACQLQIVSKFIQTTFQYLCKHSKTIMTQFLTFTDNRTPPSERQNISDHDLSDQDFEDRHYSGNFKNN